MLCSQCGSTATPTSRYCGTCGKSLHDTCPAPMTDRADAMRRAYRAENARSAEPISQQARSASPQSCRMETKPPARRSTHLEIMSPLSGQAGGEATPPTSDETDQSTPGAAPASVVIGQSGHFRYVCSRPSCQSEAAGPGVCERCGAPVLKMTAPTSQGTWIPPKGPAVEPTQPKTTTRLPGTRHRRSMAWVLYAFLAPLLLIGSFIVIGQGTVGTGLAGLLLAALAGLYARYLFRGGSIVFVPLPGCLVLLVMMLLVPIGIALTITGGRLA